MWGFDEEEDDSGSRHKGSAVNRKSIPEISMFEDKTTKDWGDRLSTHRCGVVKGSVSSKLLFGAVIGNKWEGADMDEGSA